MIFCKYFLLSFEPCLVLGLLPIAPGRRGRPLPLSPSLSHPILLLSSSSLHQVEALSDTNSPTGLYRHSCIYGLGCPIFASRI